MTTNPLRFFALVIYFLMTSVTSHASEEFLKLPFFWPQGMKSRELFKSANGLALKAGQQIVVPAASEYRHQYLFQGLYKNCFVRLWQESGKFNVEEGYWNMPLKHLFKNAHKNRVLKAGTYLSFTELGYGNEPMAGEHHKVYSIRIPEQPTIFGEAGCVAYHSEFFDDPILKAKYGAELLSDVFYHPTFEKAQSFLNEMTIGTVSREFNEVFEVI